MNQGIDGIDYEIIIIERLNEKYELILLEIFNEMYRTNSYPSDWKKTYVHFVTKKDGNSVRESVRPIIFTSNLCEFLALY